MKKQLLLTSALVSGLVAAGSAQAETKITGDYKLSYILGESKTGTQKSEQGMGRETQINVSKSGDLDNGLAYKTGFSFEADGNTVTADEGVYFQVSAGNTDILVGMDKAPNMDTSAVPRVGENAATGLNAYGPTSSQNPGSGKLAYSQSVGTIYGKAGIAVSQNTDFGKLTLNYVPNTADSGNAANDMVAQSSNVNSNDGKDAYEATFKGNLGVDGLTAYVGKRVSQKNGTDEKDDEGKAYGLSYNFGQISVGANKSERIHGDDGQETETTEFGATYAASDAVTLGIGYAETEGVAADGTSETSDEEITYVQAGYNLGAVTLQATYYSSDNVGFTEANDADLLLLRIGTKF